MKRKLIKILLLFLALIIGIKTYLEIDAHLFETRIEKIQNMESLNNTIKSTVTHKTLSINDFEIHYYVSGQENKNLIVFLHPAFSDHRAFNQQIDFFSKDYKVITIDLIGHGLSKANSSKDKIDASTKHISEILKKEGHYKAHFVGVSMGSLIAQYYALKSPETIKTLTALGGYNINKNSDDVQKAQNQANFSLIIRAIFSMKAFRKKTAEITCKSKKGQALFYQAASLYERKSFLVMQGLKNVVKDRENIRTHYPTLIITGEYDIDLAKEKAKEWHAEIKNSTYSMINNAGHCANMDKPNDFNIIVNEFISKY